MVDVKVISLRHLRGNFVAPQRAPKVAAATKGYSSNIFFQNDRQHRCELRFCLTWVVSWMLTGGWPHPLHAQNEPKPPSATILQNEPLDRMKESAESGDRESQYRVGLAYYLGYGVARDLAGAESWIRKAALQGHAAAQAALGRMYYGGEGVPRDFAEAAVWYRRAASQGDAQAQYNLAGLLAAGEGVSRDSAEAAKWYRGAAGLGLAEAQYALAFLYSRGEGVPQDRQEAMSWIRSAAALGHSQAQFSLAQQYENGTGVKRDPGEALRWFRRAAEGGHAEAQATLAAKYFQAAKNSPAAALWYQYAAEQGHVRAQCILGLLYEKGWGGVSADPVRAHMWFSVAGLHASEAQIREFAGQREETARRLSREQLAESQRLAREWKPKTWADLKTRGSVGLSPAGGLASVGDFASEAGQSIDAAEQHYLAYWQPHIKESHRRILEAAKLVRKPRTALVLGAGRCREIPLEGLAERFDQVVLVDLDGPGMKDAVLSIRPDLQRKIEIRVADVTSFAESLMDATKRITESAVRADQAFTQLTSVYRNIGTNRRFPDLPRGDLVISSLVLSELARYPSTYTARLLARRFQVSLSEWKGYGDLWANLRSFTLRDHAELLARFCAPGGVVYYADTVARGPHPRNLSEAERRSARRNLGAAYGRLGIFRTLQSRPEVLTIFQRILPAVEGMNDAVGSGAHHADQVLDEIGGHRDLRPESAEAAANAVTRLLCQGYFPAEMETRAYERLVEAFQEASPAALERLVDQDEFFAALGARGLKPVSGPESWWWLEYACTIPENAGAFLVRSWILRPEDR